MFKASHITLLLFFYSFSVFSVAAQQNLRTVLQIDGGDFILSPDQQIFYSNGKLWDINTLRAFYDLPSEFLKADVKFTSDGKYIKAFFAGSYTVFSISDRKVVQKKYDPTIVPIRYYHEWDPDSDLVLFHDFNGDNQYYINFKPDVPEIRRTKNGELDLHIFEFGLDHPIIPVNDQSTSVIYDPDRAPGKLFFIRNDKDTTYKQYARASIGDGIINAAVSESGNFLVRLPNCFEKALGKTGVAKIYEDIDFFQSKSVLVVSILTQYNKKLPHHHRYFFYFAHEEIVNLQNSNIHKDFLLIQTNEAFWTLNLQQMEAQKRLQIKDLKKHLPEEVDSLLPADLSEDEQQFFIGQHCFRLSPFNYIGICRPVNKVDDLSSNKPSKRIDNNLVCLSPHYLYDSTTNEIYHTDNKEEPLKEPYDIAYLSPAITSQIVSSSEKFLIRAVAPDKVPEMNEDNDFCIPHHAIAYSNLSDELEYPASKEVIRDCWIFFDEPVKDFVVISNQPDKLQVEGRDNSWILNFNDGKLTIDPRRIKIDSLWTRIKPLIEELNKKKENWEKLDTNLVINNFAKSLSRYIAEPHIINTTDNTVEATIPGGEVIYKEANLNTIIYNDWDEEEQVMRHYAFNTSLKQAQPIGFRMKDYPLMQHGKDILAMADFNSLLFTRFSNFATQHVELPEEREHSWLGGFKFTEKPPMELGLLLIEDPFSSWDYNAPVMSRMIKLKPGLEHISDKIKEAAQSMSQGEEEYLSGFNSPRPFYLRASPEFDKEQARNFFLGNTIFSDQNASYHFSISPSGRYHLIFLLRQGSGGFDFMTFIDWKKNINIDEAIIGKVGDKSYLTPRPDTIDGQYFVTGSFSPDEKHMLIVGFSNLFIIELPSLKVIKIIPNVENATFWESCRGLFLNKGNGQLQLYDLEKDSVMANLFIFPDGELNISTSDNYYYSSKNKVDIRVFFIGSQLYTYDQFDLRLNRPDKVLSALAVVGVDTSNVSTYRQAYQKRLEKYGFTEDMLSDDYHVPKCVIKNEDSLPLTSSDSDVKLDIEALDSLQLLDRLNIYVNDVPVYGISGIDLRPQNTPQYDTTLTLPLSSGQNKIQVSVLNQGGAESLKATIYITYDAPAKKPNLYLLAIGVSDYQADGKDLQYAAKDAQDIANFYQKNTAFDQTYIKTLTNNQVTKSNILALRDWLKNTSVDDQVIIYVSGHGLLDENYDFYYATHDIDFSKPSISGILYDEIEGLLDGIPARKKLLLMDACHSGEYDKEAATLTSCTARQHDSNKGVTVKAFPKGSDDENAPLLGLQNSFEMMQQLFADLRRGSGATVITSSSGVQVSYEDGGMAKRSLSPIHFPQWPQNHAGGC